MRIDGSEYRLVLVTYFGKEMEKPSFEVATELATTSSPIRWPLRRPGTSDGLLDRFGFFLADSLGDSGVSWILGLVIFSFGCRNSCTVRWMAAWEAVT